MKKAVHVFIKYQEMGIYLVDVQENDLKVCSKKYQKLNSVNLLRKKIKILIAHMSDIYNSDYCIEEFLQMNFYIV